MKRNKTLRNFALAIGFIVVWFAVVDFAKQHQRTSVSATPETTRYAHETLVPMDGDTLASLIGQGKPTVLFLYASWCPYCKQQFGILDSIKRDDVTFIYASLDESVHALSAFLMQRFPQLPFTPYHVSGRYSFDSLLKQRGFSPDGGVPHLMVFDKEGNRAAEFLGRTPAEDITRALNTVTF